jgi:hypothetical protein
MSHCRDRDWLYQGLFGSFHCPQIVLTTFVANRDYIYASKDHYSRNIKKFRFLSFGSRAESFMRAAGVRVDRIARWRRFCSSGNTTNHVPR